jgi:Protein of unknown function (DUF1566)
MKGSIKKSFATAVLGLATLVSGAVAQQQQTPGNKMPDGTIYAGADYFSGKAIYTTPHDAPLEMTFNQAINYCANLDAHGHRDWRLPASGELDEMFKNRATIGGFDLSPSDDSGWYWSSQRADEDEGRLKLAAVRHFSDGNRRLNFTFMLAPVRCVR